ncbi:DNA primase [Rhodocyclus tenuis]|uniref:DNA primase n=1 Tax=Rhodocyclus tenuis TaxID=1066 RepID=A0A840G4H7_RHOTE|nr:DNA primase [Rhodocyclus tenuis]MBB4247293.1 DNA primase [Rhodocyclus tenuis]
MIPESFIQELLHRVDIVDLIDSHVPLKKAGANYAACCPFHNEKSPSFTVSPSKQFYHCFGCGAHGTAIGFMMEYAGLGFIDAVRELANRVGMVVPEDERRRPADAPQTVALAEAMGRAARFYYESLKTSPKAIAYLKSRGVSGEVARRFGIGYAGDGWQNLEQAFERYDDPALQSAGLVIRNEQGRLYDRFRDRVMFPIINAKGEVIAFGGRVLGEGEPKYLNSPETPLFEKGREVFGLPQARAALRETNTAIVVEGYMDVVALAQHGVGNALATLGTATTPTHVQKLLRQVDRIAYCFDGDSAGRKAAWRALENSLEALPEQKSIGFVFLPPEDDPDSYVRAHGADEFKRLVAQATPLSDFMLGELSAHCDLASAEGRAQLVAAAKPLLGRLQTPLLRLQIVKQLAEKTGFSQAEVERLCDLRPITRPAPARAPRRPPSLARALLALLLQKPELARQVPLAALTDSSGEARAVRQLCAAVADAGPVTPGLAALIERLRGSDEESVLREAAAELMQHPFAEEDIDSEFAGAIEQLQAGEQRRAFEELQTKVQRLGVSGLNDNEKRQYLAALSGRNPPAAVREGN